VFDKVSGASADLAFIWRLPINSALDSNSSRHWCASSALHRGIDKSPRTGLGLPRDVQTVRYCQGSSASCGVIPVSKVVASSLLSQENYTWYWWCNPENLNLQISDFGNRTRAARFVVKKLTTRPTWHQALDVSLVWWLASWLRTSRLGFQKSGDMNSPDSIKILILWTVTPSLVEAFHAAFYSLYPHQSYWVASLARSRSLSRLTGRVRRLVSLAHRSTRNSQAKWVQ